MHVCPPSLSLSLSTGVYQFQRNVRATEQPDSNDTANFWLQNVHDMDWYCEARIKYVLCSKTQSDKTVSTSTYSSLKAGAKNQWTVAPGMWHHTVYDTRGTSHMHTHNKVGKHVWNAGIDSPETCHPNFHCCENFNSCKIAKLMH
jgi:hypothetical protein